MHVSIGHAPIVFLRFHLSTPNPVIAVSSAGPVDLKYGEYDVPNLSVFVPGEGKPSLLSESPFPTTAITTATIPHSYHH